MTALAVAFAAAPTTARARVFEQALGDPQLASSPSGFAAAVAADRRGEFPAATCAALDAAGLRDASLEAIVSPSAALETLTVLLRLAARRDPTAAFVRAIGAAAGMAVAHSGDAIKTADVISALGRGGSIGVALPDGCSVHPPDAELMLVHSRSGRRDVVAVLNIRSGGSVLPEAPLKTVGLVGAGFRALPSADVRIPRTAVLADGASAATLAARSGDMTAVLMAAVALGAADTALRAAATFARDRRMYGATVLDIPHARSLLTGALCELLACEAVTWRATRAIAANDESAPFWSNVLRIFVFRSMGRLIDKVAVVLGARYYLREGHWHGIFEKIVRDHTVLETRYGASPQRIAAFGADLRHSRSGGSPVDDPEFWRRLEHDYGDRWHQAPVVVDLGRERARVAAVRATDRTLHASAPAAFDILRTALDSNLLFSHMNVPLAGEH